MQTLAARRTYLKVKVTESADTDTVRDIMATWATLRATPKHLMRAIRLYESLRSGDAALFWQLLSEFFPGVALGMQLGGAGRQSYSQPLAAPAAKLKVEMIKRNAAEMLEEAGDEFDIDGMF